MPKVWLITGSSGSLGRTIAEAALAAGDKLLATAREPARLQDLVHCYGSRIRTVQHDVRNASVAATAVQIAVDAFDRLDVVVNAARSADPAVEDFSVESFRVPIETNLFGFAYLIDATLPILRQQRSGHIWEPALYFSASSYATVGYGDVVVPSHWRMLGPLESIIGVLMCGMSVSVLFATVTRLVGRDARSSDK